MEILRRREEERRKALEEAKKFCQEAEQVLGKLSAAIIGSYARGTSINGAI